MRAIHRATMVIAVIFLLFLGITGTIIQGIDLTKIIAGAPPTDPTMESIEDGLTGPPNYIVRTDADYSAAALPNNLDLSQATVQVARTARSIIGDKAFDFLELRMNGNRPVGLVQAGGRLMTIDPASSALVSDRAADPITMFPSMAFRDQVKNIHRMAPFFGGWAMWFQLGSAIGLLTLITTGFLLYLQLLKARRRIKRKSLFWKAGDNWRMLHRGISLVAAIFLVIVAVSGGFLAIDNIGGSFYMKAHGLGGPNPNQHDPLMSSAAAPLVDRQLPAMLNTTIQSYRQNWGDTPIKVIRLRYYGTMPQGVIVTGGARTDQLVFDTSTGVAAGMTEKGYPETPFPFGWAWHEAVKQVHRGSYLGLTSRVTDLFAGFSLVYLTISGMVMYWQLYRRRLKGGKRELFWK